MNKTKQELEEAEAVAWEQFKRDNPGLELKDNGLIRHAFRNCFGYGGITGTRTMLEEILQDL